MRIVMLHSTPLPAREGIGFYVWNLSRYLTRCGHQVQIITRGGLRHTRREVVDGITIWRAPFAPVYPLHVQLHRLFVQPLVRRLEAHTDLFHLHAPLPPPIITQRPVLLTMHSALRHDIGSTRLNSAYTLAMKLQAPVSYRIEQQLLSMAQGVNAVSPQVVDALQVYAGCPAQVRAVWNGVDDSMFAPGLNQSRAQRQVLAVGRLAPGKGLEELIAAVALVHQRIGPLRLLIVGEGPLRPALERQIARSGLDERVVLLGHISDRSELARLYRQASLFVLPSHHEGLPTVLLEAMACGCPAVATRVGGVPHVITHEHNGLLVPPRDVAQLAEALTRLVQSPQLQATLGQNARRTIEERFSWEVVGRGMVEEYERVRGLGFQVPGSRFRVPGSGFGEQ